MASGTHVAHRNLGKYRRGQVVDPSGWRWRKLLEDNGWITELGDRPTFKAADGTVWVTRKQADERGGAVPHDIDPTPESSEPPAEEAYEFTPAAEAVIHGEGFDLDDYDGDATGATGNVLKSDAEAWVASQ